MTRFATILLLLLSLEVAWSAEFIDQTQFLMKIGDDPRWMESSLDERNWTPVDLRFIQSEDLLWLRTPVHLSQEHFVPGHPLAIFFAALASHEIYWDGVLIGRGGKPAITPAEEIPGPIQAHYLIPEHLARPGSHSIAIRTSAHHRHFNPMSGYWTLLIGDYDQIIGVGRYTPVSLISLSGMILVAIFAFLLFLADRGDRSYLLLALLAIVAALLLIAEAWRNLFGYTYNWHLLRLSIITGLTALLNFLLLLFVIVRFPGDKHKVALAIAVFGFLVSMFIPGWDFKTLGMFLVGIGLSFLWTLRAAADRRRGSWLAMLGLSATGVALFWQPFLFADLTVYFGIDFLLLCLLASHVLQVRQVRLEREEARLKSTRLELELLKKHIQPHYLMNTLTALSEWIEQEPKEATKMIQSLSDEFRVLSEVSSRSLIALKDEIRLCSSHAEIMSKRKGKEFVLSVNGIDPDLLIPPAILHTMVENAIIHNRPVAQRIEFCLDVQKENGFYHYTLKSPLGSATPGEICEGTGFRYIKSRLQESYGNKWKFQAGREGDVWKNEIWIPVE
jgi:hypothetical protein